MNGTGEVAQAGGSRSPGVWSDAAVWEGDGLRREVFFFRSGGADLYGSLFMSVQRSRRFGVVACNSWGIEADRSDPLQRSAVLAMARLGGAGMVFHYPGFSDSFGDLAGVDLDVLSVAARDALNEAARRCPGIEWILAGFMLGASVACLAQSSVASRRLLLVQPALEPGSYFRWLANRATTLAPGPGPASRGMIEVGATPGMAYGYPIPQSIVKRSEQANDAVRVSLEEFEGSGAVLRHALPENGEPIPPRFEQVHVPGTWRFGAQNHAALARASAEWLDRHTQEGRDERE